MIQQGVYGWGGATGDVQVSGMVMCAGMGIYDFGV